VGNAAVGSYIDSIAGESHRRFSPVFLFFREVMFHTCGRLRGSALSSEFSDGNPCFGVRGEK